LPPEDQAKGAKLEAFLASDALDAKFAKYVVLSDATPGGLAEYASQGKEQTAWVEKLLADADLMQQMLVADGAKCKPGGGDTGPAQYGPAMQIYATIQEASKKASTGIFQRLALAVALEHSVPVTQTNPTAKPNAPATVDPVARYLHFEKAYLDGELDPAFDQLSAWELRMVVNGDAPDTILAWGREMLRNFRPDHIYTSNHGWRYSGLVGSDVRYGSGDVKYDRPELHSNQNILMNGGVCGRRAFIGRFILRAHGIPTIPKPSRGHGALARWTPEGWVVNLGPNWGGGWTGTRYRNDHDFVATTRARARRNAFLKVKRAQWAGDVAGEPRLYGEHGGGTPGFWYGLSFRTQRAIIEEAGTKTLDALGAELGESNEQLTLAEEVAATEIKPGDNKISYNADGSISIPAALSNPSGSTKDVLVMRSFAGGRQLFLPRFAVQGLTLLRGGAWRSTPATSADRLKSSGYGRYNNWGFRAAMTLADGDPMRDITVDMGDGLKMAFVYIKPGTFTMGGDNSSDSKWTAINTPKHEVTISKGFYMGKYEVTQAQFQHIMGSNPSRGSKDPNSPADNIHEADAFTFCADLSAKVGRDVRLPTEAEWEYACRAGTDTTYFFGDSPETYGEYAWFKDNDGGKSHPVGQKKPNPWGLYDIYGNVFERVSDRFDKDYYAKGPKVDPTGFDQGKQSQMEYQVNAPRGGTYELTAEVCTANYEQMLNTAVGDATPVVLEMPFTLGSWKPSKPVTITLEEGANALRMWRDNPPQYGMAIKSFALKPVM
jgi:formylglycine-generating enzyme required for sulfatase activity